MDPCTKESVAKEFATQIQLGTARLLAKDSEHDYNQSTITAARVAKINSQAAAAAAIYNARNPEEPEDLATLRADLATVSASRDLAWDRTLRARPTGAPVAARIASQRRGAVVATLLLRDATPFGPFTAA
jgi:hypothetical protein